MRSRFGVFKVLAAVAFTIALSLGLSGVAHAQYYDCSNPAYVDYDQCKATTTSTTVFASSTTATTLARTGFEAGTPIALGGGMILLLIAVRQLARARSSLS